MKRFWERLTWRQRLRLIFIIATIGPFIVFCLNTGLFVLSATVCVTGNNLPQVADSLLNIMPWTGGATVATMLSLFVVDPLFPLSWRPQKMEEIQNG